VAEVRPVSWASSLNDRVGGPTSKLRSRPAHVPRLSPGPAELFGNMGHRQ